MADTSPLVSIHTLREATATVLERRNRGQGRWAACVRPYRGDP